MVDFTELVRETKEKKRAKKRKIIIELLVKGVGIMGVLAIMVVYIQELTALGSIRIARYEACVKILSSSGLELLDSSNPAGSLFTPYSCIGRPKNLVGDGVLHDKTDEFRQYISDNKIGLDNPKYGVHPWVIRILGPSTNN